MKGYRAWYAWNGGRGAWYDLYKGLDICHVTVAADNDSWPTFWPTLNAALHTLRVTN